MYKISENLKIFAGGFIFTLVIGLTGFILTARASEMAGAVTFPISELGGCQDQAACATYCDQQENMESCIVYGAKQGMLSEQEAIIAQKAVAKIKNGETPGGCKDKESCANYCQSNLQDLNVCIGFAEEIGLPASEIAQAKKIAKALEKGAGLPGNCNGKGACENYCKDSKHIDECLIFAEAAEILPPEELAEAKKVAKFIKSGEMPGGCTGKDECKAFCDQDENFEECINFAQKAELVSPEEFEMAKKTGGKGPGGCKSKQTCAEYCNDPQNAAACASFALEKGLVTEEEAENIRTGDSKIQAGLDGAPAEIRGEIEACLNELMGGNLAAVLAGTQQMTQSQGNAVGGCFTQAAQNFAAQQAAAGAAAGAAAAGQAGGAGGGMPNGAPSGPPAGAPDMKNIPPAGATGGPVSAPTNKPTPPATQPSQAPANAPAGPDCSAFASVPSCSMVGGGQAETFCKKCFPNK